MLSRQQSNSRPDRSRPATHLKKRAGTYYFRIGIPTGIRHRFCADELKFSLRTSDPKEAKRRSVVITGKVVVLFHKLELSRSGLMSNLSPDKLRKVVRDYVTKGWNFDPVVKDSHDVDRQYELTEDRIAELKEELVLNWNNKDRIVGRPCDNGEVVSNPWIDWLIEDHNLQGKEEELKSPSIKN
jgi:hypothetical protein